MSLLVLLAIQAAASLWWRFVHDGPLLQYAAFLVLEHGRVPYRDIFDLNLPGTYLFNIFWIKTFGYSNIGFRLLDLLWLGSILSVIYHIIRRFGEVAAWMAVAVVGISYLSDAPLDSLQREWIIVLPLLIAMLLVVELKFSRAVRGLIVGMLFGYIFMVKPHAVMLWFLLLIFETTARTSETETARDSFRRAVVFSGFTTIGVVAVIVPIVWWLSANSAWSPFMEIVRNYYPLYLELSSNHFITVGFERFALLVIETVGLGGNASWIIAAGVGYWLLLNRVCVSRSEKRVLALLGSAGIIYMGYPAVSGKFWHYHFAFMQVFIYSLAAATLFHRDLKKALGNSRFPSALLLAAFLLGPRFPPFNGFIGDIIHLRSEPPNFGRVDEISGFLKSHLKPGDKVQPLDWTGGAIHAALAAKADLATSFIWDAQFYHHIDSPYIVGLRRRFISELTTAKPRFILEVTAEDNPWPSGPNTTRDFPELSAFIRDNYENVLEQNGYRIWERIKEANVN